MPIAVGLLAGSCPILSPWSSGVPPASSNRASRRRLRGHRPARCDPRNQARRLSVAVGVTAT